ncbi:MULTISPECIES: hypothetical protein [unclassified Arsenophonus]|uniref:hypothetical protein n=1 Tax=unclassified Arsenophonus TaxID=2627083 RepID=UPI00285D219F|nr:hypothetical protein [Arsenophonus sp.]MDR5611286.1 hypothetical protein [Arsenophonus sp.]MDR5615355.1 hypothetical protein [Arsenophonus sp.]
MDIELKHKKVESIELISLTKINSVKLSSLMAKIASEHGQEFHMAINYEIYRHQSNKKTVRIRYTVIYFIQDNFSLSLAYDFSFKSDKEITEDFNASETARKLAPSISYPYIKSYIENFLTLSGYKDFEVPFIDFNKEPFEF